MKSILLILILAFSLPGFAQYDTTRRMEGSVVVHKDPRIDLLIAKQASINTTSKKMYGRTMRGYRLMVMNTNKRDEAIAAKTKVYTAFPELKAYLVYQAPFFRLKAGNFKTRDEAARYQRMMNTYFPKGVFIVNDVIEVKPEETPEE